jgi:peptidoglycan biosynthesis protein MviN/MurJ (putative lipid II flippase)
VSLAALAGGVLNSYGKFAVPATTSTLMNLVMIVFAAWIAPHFDRPGVVLAIGVFVSGLVQLGFQVPFMLKLGLLRRPPRTGGKIRLVRIGAGETPVDLQPCGGTHVASTAEIGRVVVTKLENKGKQNRRVYLVLED